MIPAMFDIMQRLDGKQLRHYRLQAGLTQAGLAAKLGVTANTVARWERGEVTIPALLTLAIVGLAKNPSN